ncbi:hypothetical protein HC928_10895, partial [bacterium]|nr:hypothetical protein [bacterium]
MTVWLPPYCSDLNPIERFWKHLKDKACANRLFKQIQEVIDSVEKVLTIQNDLTHSDRFLFQKLLSDYLSKPHKVFGRKKRHFCAVYSSNWQIPRFFILKN